MNTLMSKQPRRRIGIGGTSIMTAIVAAACLFAAPVFATPSFGFVSQTFRGRIAENVGAHQWNPGPLFTLLIQSSNDQWGFDVVQGTTEFAPMDSTGRPSQSGWHDHPTALSIGLVIQGTVWSHEAGATCLHPIPAGSVFFERGGQIHNNYNLDPRVPAVVRIIHFLDRNQTATRRDQPDPLTGNPAAAAPPPQPCPPDTAAAPHVAESTPPIVAAHAGLTSHKNQLSMNALLILAGASNPNEQPLAAAAGVIAAAPDRKRRVSSRR